MADSKISALPASTVPLAGTEVLPIVQSSATKKVSVADLTAGRSVSVADLAVSTGNIVPGTAAKGINFTANTPAAGMTSQLLNWYEEGNWSPSRSGFTEVLGAGSITTTGRYIKVGNTVTTQASIVCTGGATIAALPGIGSSLGNLPFAPTTLGAGAWVNGTSVADDGGFLVHTNGNFYITTGWVASSSTFYFSATYLTI